jgi:hypothetical protein
MKWQLHGSYWLVLLALAVFGGIKLQQASDAKAKLRFSADSAAHVQDSLNAKTALLKLEFQKKAHDDSLFAAKILARQKADSVATVRARAETATLRASLDSAQKVQLDSIVHTYTDQVVQAQADRDSALVRLARAQTRITTLDSLVGDYQTQLHVAVAKLQQAAKIPFWDTPVVSVATKALAIYGGCKALGKCS